MTGAAITTVDGKVNNNPGNYAPPGSWPAVPPTAPPQVRDLTAGALMTVYVKRVMQEVVKVPFMRLTEDYSLTLASVQMFHSSLQISNCCYLLISC